MIKLILWSEFRTVWCCNALVLDIIQAQFLHYLWCNDLFFYHEKLHAMEENKRSGTPGQGKQDQERNQQGQRDQQQGNRGMDRDMNQNVSREEEDNSGTERNRDRQGDQGQRGQQGPSGRERGGVL